MYRLFFLWASFASKYLKKMKEISCRRKKTDFVRRRYYYYHKCKLFLFSGVKERRGFVLFHVSGVCYRFLASLHEQKTKRERETLFRDLLRQTLTIPNLQRDLL